MVKSMIYDKNEIVIIIPKMELLHDGMQGFQK